MDITDTLDYDSIDPKTLTAVNTRKLDAPRHGHEHHGVVYSNKLPLNHDITTLPDLQKCRLLLGVGVHRLLLLRLGALPGEVAANATVEAPSLAALPFAPRPPLLLREQEPLTITMAA